MSDLSLTILSAFVANVSLFGLLLLDLANDFVEVVVTCFIGCVVLEHFVFVVVARLVVKSSNKANQKQGEVNPNPVVHRWWDAFV